MQNLELLGVTELDAHEVISITGGESFAYRLANIVGEVFDAAIDTWNGFWDGVGDALGG